MKESTLRSDSLPCDQEESFQGTILLVEDYQPNILVAAIMLENMGFKVESVDSGLLAVEKIKECIVPYTAILMDIRLYDMDGLETTRAIRQLEKEKHFRQPILGMTAHTLGIHHTKCLEAGMDDYISKPINFDTLARKLSHFSSSH
ncbi:MAG TPA: response regulator [Rickettsiales bacterium]|nr:response regulator [Rickettsiales bacterium]